jgi:predicted acylesterase/phospholipase RssA
VIFLEAHMTTREKPIKRAITLAGGGPTAGLHLGVLKYFKEADIEFDVWALSCIGAWVGIVYNQYDKGREVDQTINFFKNGVFRDDVGYSRFPINAVFGPDWSANAQALLNYLWNAETYKDLILPQMASRVRESVQQAMLLLFDPERRTAGDFNQWMLNHVLAINPLVRFFTSMMFLSPVNGLARVYYPDSSFLKAIKFAKLSTAKQFIFHNAWNITKKRLELFSNRKFKGRNYKEINAATLCACSALPFIEPTVEMDGDIYCEGALVDTVNFKNLIEDHSDLDEIWVSRIVDSHQIRAPRNLTDGLGNLCELFAATVGEDDVKLFRHHVKETSWRGTVIEIQIGTRRQINFNWSHDNLNNGIYDGYHAAKAVHERYKEEIKEKKDGKFKWIRVEDLHRRRKR